MKKFVIRIIKSKIELRFSRKSSYCPCCCRRWTESPHHRPNRPTGGTEESGMTLSSSSVNIISCLAILRNTASTRQSAGPALWSMRQTHFTSKQVKHVSLTHTLTWQLLQVLVRQPATEVFGGAEAESRQSRGRVKSALGPRLFKPDEPLT